MYLLLGNAVHEWLVVSLFSGLVFAVLLGAIIIIITTTTTTTTTTGRFHLGYVINVTIYFFKYFLMFSHIHNVYAVTYQLPDIKKKLHKSISFIHLQLIETGKYVLFK